MLGLDFRSDQWGDARAFGVNARAALRVVDIVIGTCEEAKAAALREPLAVSVSHSQVSDARVRGDLVQAVETLLGFGIEALVVTHGQHGATVHTRAAKGCTPLRSRRCTTRLVPAMRS